MTDLDIRLRRIRFVDQYDASAVDFGCRYNLSFARPTAKLCLDLWEDLRRRNIARDK